MLKLAATARQTPPDNAADDPPAAPPTSAERLRADLDAARGSTLRNAERVLRLARERRAAASEAYNGAIQEAIAESHASRTSQSPAERAAERTLAEADAAIAAPRARLQEARESAEPKIRAAAAPHLKEAAEKLMAASAAVGEVRDVLAATSRFCAENGMNSAHSPHSLPSARVLKELADRLARGVL